MSTVTTIVPRLLRWGRLFSSFVKFEHTLFALPFAYVGMLIAAEGIPSLRAFVWITLAMVGARTAAMAINRVVDARIDARNPRTAQREIPAGHIMPAQGVLIAVAASLLLIVAGLALNRLTAQLLPVALIFLALYPYTKRFTWLCHIWLGITIGAAAAGGYIAVTGEFSAVTWLLWLGVGAWIAGFDVLYAFLDLEFDTSNGVHSIPARFGVKPARTIAAALHLVAGVALLALPLASSLGWLYLSSIALTVVPLLIWQHLLVARKGAAVALAAFNANLWISSLVLIAVVTDLLF